jgi:hypothetical protein
MGEGTLWVDFKKLYHCYQQVALNNHIMSLETLICKIVKVVTKYHRTSYTTELHI